MPRPKAADLREVPLCARCGHTFSPIDATRSQIAKRSNLLKANVQLGWKASGLLSGTGYKKRTFDRRIAR